MATFQPKTPFFQGANENMILYRLFPLNNENQLSISISGAIKLLKNTCFNIRAISQPL